MKTNQSTPQPSAAVLDAWAAWQARLDAMPHLTPDQKQQATAVLIKLMTKRAERQKSQ